jgi:hypothetical protein
MKIHKKKTLKFKNTGFVLNRINLRGDSLYHFSSFLDEDLKSKIGTLFKRSVFLKYFPDVFPIKYFLTGSGSFFRLSLEGITEKGLIDSLGDLKSRPHILSKNGSYYSFLKLADLLIPSCFKKTASAFIFKTHPIKQKLSLNSFVNGIISIPSL